MMDFEASDKLKVCDGDGNDGNLHDKWIALCAENTLSSDVKELVSTEDFEIEDDDDDDEDDDVALLPRFTPVSSLGTCSDKVEGSVKKRLFDDSDSLHISVKKSKVSLYDDCDEYEDEDGDLLSDRARRLGKSVDRSFSSLKNEIEFVEKAFEECKRKRREEEKRLESVKREIEECSRELVNKKTQFSCVRRINEVHSKLLGKIEECVNDFLLKEIQIHLMECVIEEHKHELKTKETELHQAKEIISKEVELCQVIDEDRGREKEELEALSQKIAECIVERETKEKELDAMKTSIDEQGEVLESERKKLLKVISVRNNCQVQMKEFESMKKRFEDEVKELESTEKQCKRRLEVLRSKEGHLEVRVKALESREKQLEGNVKQFESKIEELGDRMKELESEKKHFENWGNELASKEKQVEERAMQLKSKEMRVEEWMIEVVSKEEKFEGQVKELVSKQKHFEIRTEELDSKERQLESRLKEQESKERELEGQVKELESKEAHFEKKVNELESRENRFAGQMKEFESKKKEFEANLNELVKELVSKQKHYDNRTKGLESKEKQLEDRVKEHESKEKDFEDQMKELETKKKHFEIQVEELNSKETQLKGQVRDEFEGQMKDPASENKQFKSRVKALECKEKQVEKQMKALQLKEAEFERQVKEFQSKEKLEGQANNLESKLNKFGGKLKEPELTKKQHEPLIKHFDKGKEPAASYMDDQLSPTMDGTSLQFDTNEKTDGIESLCNDILVYLQELSDPSRTVLNILQNPKVPRCREGDNDVIIDASCICLLEQLMRISPNIKACVRKEALKLALVLKANMKGNSENSLVILGFLLILSIYGLLTSFNEHEVLELLSFVAHHKIAMKLFETLGFANKVYDFVENLIRRKQFVEAVRFSCTYNLAGKNQLVDMLRKHVRNAKLICESSCEKTNSIEIKDKARDQEIASLETVLQCISDNRSLESEDLLDKIQNRILELQAHKSK
ncbi:intracellular protein transport protein USO1-like [Vicia villosa]|uniref:intracellular protein transport protein USO1-like n=1 Tax=Vicia villosa TaxID=3911 RepID=UPI00273C1C57|nr:intracellular protein transport protein USO1-like [Vicia villosa]